MSPNGANGQPPQVQITAADAARAALMFLARAEFRAHERPSFDVAESLLKAIAEGQAVVQQAEQKLVTPQPQPVLNA